MNRTSISPQTQARVLTASKRRCAICVALQNESTEKAGQIAHVNQDASDNRFENLVWLCFEHHDKYDSKTSQSKNYTAIEVTIYRDNLYSSISAAKYPEEEIVKIRNFLTELSVVLTYLFCEREQLAQAISSKQMTLIELAVDTWESSALRSFTNDIRLAQDRLMSNLRGVLSIYDLDCYESKGPWIKYDNYRFPRDRLKSKEREVVKCIDSIIVDYEWLRTVASA